MPEPIMIKTKDDGIQIQLAQWGETGKPILLPARYHRQLPLLGLPGGYG